MGKYKFLVLGVISVLLTVGLLTALPQGTSDAKSDTSAPTTSASAVFVKFEGVDGESKDDAHGGWCDALSFNQEIINTPVDSRIGRRQGKPVLEDIIITKEIDKASPKLAESVCKGKVFAKVEIHLAEYFTSSGSEVYYKYELKNVMVTSYNIGGSSGSEEVPMEEFSLNFEEIKVTYTEYDDKGKSKGNVEYTWKVEEGES